MKLDELRSKTDWLISITEHWCDELPGEEYPVDAIKKYFLACVPFDVVVSQNAARLWILFNQVVAEFVSEGD